MSDYEKLYYKLYNGISDIIDELKKLQLEAEEEFMASPEHLKLIKNDKEID